MALATKDTLKIEITGYRAHRNTEFNNNSTKPALSTTLSTKNSHILFTLQIKFGRVEYTLEKRFSELYNFYEFHEKTGIFKNINFPSKTLFKSRAYDEVFLEKRRSELEIFVKNVGEIYRELQLFDDKCFRVFFELYRAECIACILNYKSRLEVFYENDRNLEITTLELWSLTQVTKTGLEIPKSFPNQLSFLKIEDIGYILDRLHSSSSIQILPDTKSTSFSNIPFYSLDLGLIIKTESTKRLIIDFCSIFLFKSFLPDLSYIVELAIINCPDLSLPGQILAKNVYEICGRPNSATEGIFRTMVLQSQVWPNLKHLDLSSCQIDYLDLSIFRLLPELEYLDLSKNQITEIDKTCFYDNRRENSKNHEIRPEPPKTHKTPKTPQNRLKTLDLSGNSKLSKIPTLYLLKNLEKLILSETQISNLSFLTQNLENLSYLDVSNCKITDFEFLHGLKLLKSLENINCYQNPVEISIEYRCKLIAYCTWNILDRKMCRLVVDGRAVKISEMRTADVIQAVEECKAEDLGARTDNYM